MKKKLLIGAVAALLLGAGVFTATALSAKEQMSDLMLANIEAITQIEGNPTMPCQGTMGYDCTGWGLLSTKCMHILAAASCSSGYTHQCCR